MHTRLDTFAVLVRPQMTPWLLMGIFALGCSSPTDAAAPVTILTEQEYLFACRSWVPAQPPVQRTLFDVRLWQIDTATAPDELLVKAITAAGGRVVYQFHGPMVRAELDVAVVRRLAGPTGPVSSAVTVVDPDSHDVTLIVLLAHDLTSADLRAAEALGGRVTHEFHALEGYVVVIDDARVPAVRALPGVRLAGFDGTVCLD